MMKKRNLALIMALALSATVLAGPVSKDEALAKAQAFVRKKSEQRTAGPRRVQQLQRQAAFVQTASENDALYYVFNIGNRNGFVIISGDDRTPDVLGYCDSGSFDVKNMPDNMRAWLQGYADQIRWLQQHPQASPTASEAPAVAMAPTRNAISPMVQTRWGQGNPFNLSCPSYKEYVNNVETTKYCVTGCVATAMAQLMAYHQWPKHTKADIDGSYYSVQHTTNYGTQTLTAKSFPANTAIDWNNMLNVYGSDATDAQKTAVAELMAMCGSAVKMGYGISASGAILSADILTNYFDYSASARNISRGNHSLAEWIALIYAELAANRPVLYSGQSSGGGHQFIIDGYDGDELFHINWGWNGGANGYYLLSILNPDDKTGIGASTSSDGYSFSQDAIIGIKPQDGEVAPNHEIKLSSTILSAQNGEITCTYGNYTGASYIFEVGIGRVADDGSITAVKNIGNARFEPGWEWDESTTITEPLPDGTHKLVPISRELVLDYYLYDTTPWYAGVNVNTNYVEVVVSGGVITSMRVFPSIALQDITITGNKKANSSQTVNATVSCNEGEFYGVLYFFTSTTQTKGFYQGRMGVTVPKGKTAQAQFTFKPTAAGTYNIWIATDELGENVVGQTTVDIGDGTATAENISVSISWENLDADAAGTYEPFGYIKNVLFGKTLKGTMSVTNNATEPFNGSVYFQLSYWSDENAAATRDNYELPPFSVEAGQTADIPFELIVPGLGYYNGYVFSMQTNGHLLSTFPIKLTPCVFEYFADGSTRATKTQGELTIAQDVVALDLEGVTGINSISGGNANTLFLFGKNDIVPKSLSERNIVKGNTAASITLHDGYDFFSPVAFTAQSISYTRTFTDGLTRDYKGWSTIALPFEVSRVTVSVGGTSHAIDWFRSATDRNKNFWLMEFSSEENGVVKFGHAERFMPARPMIVAVPGSEWGADADLTGLPITFHGDNVSIHRDFRATTTGDNYKMKAVTMRHSLSDIYVLNASGNAFNRQPTAVVDAFRSYFVPTSTAANAKQLTMAIDLGNGISAIGHSASTVHRSDDAWYSIDGRRLQGEPKQKGIYIHNGKKVIK